MDLWSHWRPGRVSLHLLLQVHGGEGLGEGRSLVEPLLPTPVQGLWVPSRPEAMCPSQGFIWASDFLPSVSLSSPCSEHPQGKKQVLDSVISQIPSILQICPSNFFPSCQILIAFSQLILLLCLKSNILSGFRGQVGLTGLACPYGSPTDGVPLSGLPAAVCLQRCPARPSGEDSL